jgi:hypothetical protein
MSDITGKSFTATIISVTKGFIGPINISYHPQVAKSGWLLRGRGDIGAVTLRFDYVSHNEDRHHYHISATDTGHYEGARLGVSQNGYVGLYHVASVSNIWKVELTGTGSVEEGFHFFLRDHWGQRVAVYPQKEQFGNLANPSSINSRIFEYLNVENGEILEFKAGNVRLQ